MFPLIIITLNDVTVAAVVDAFLCVYICWFFIVSIRVFMIKEIFLTNSL